MTRYILAGGAELRTPDKAQKFCDAVVGDLQSPHILSCFFAEPAETWDEKYNRKAKGFFETYAGPGVTVELAKPETFIQQAASADIIYIHGGQNDRLTQAMAKYPNVEQLFAGKIVVGSSAGAIYLATYSWTCDERMIYKGSGILPICTVVHFGANYHPDDPRGPIDWEQAEHEIKAASHGLPVHLLGEGEFVVLEK